MQRLNTGLQKACFSTIALLAGTAALTAQIYVDPVGGVDIPGNGTQANPYQTINYADSQAVSGDVIQLLAATYGDEQGLIQLGTKDLTIVGMGQGQTIIQAHSSLDFLIGADDYRPCVDVNGAARVDLRDLTLDGNFNTTGLASGRLYGYLARGGADGLLDNVEIINCRFNPFNGAQRPTAVVVRGDGVADPCNVTVRNCDIYEFGKNAMAAFFDANLVVENTRIKGRGHVGLGLPAQNGIQISFDARGAVRNSTITDIFYDPSSFVASGILVFDALGTVVVEDNDLGNCDAGIVIVGSANPVLNGIVRRNRVAGSSFAAVVQDVSGCTLTDNVFHVYEAADNNAAFDNGAPFSVWDNNNYSDAAGLVTYPIPGTGAVDSNPRAGCDTLGAVTAIALTAGKSPVDVVVRDFDGNGELDFATLDDTAAGPSLSIGLQTAGVFAITDVGFGVSDDNPIALTAGDLDGVGGIIDLAVVTSATPPPSQFFVFANDGFGGFTLLSTTVLANPPSDIVAGNVSGSALDDLLITENGTILLPGAANVWVNAGAGVFAAMPVPGVFTAAIQGGELADLDNDTDLDVAILEGDATSGLLHVYQNTGGVLGAAPGSPWPVANNPRALAATDLEGDGDLDLLATSLVDSLGLDNGAATVFENIGAFGFTSTVHFTDKGPTGIATGDLNDDACPGAVFRDAAIVNRTASSITILGRYVGGYGYSNGGICVTGGVPSAVALAEMNGDLFTDLVYTDAAAGTVVITSGKPTGYVASFGLGCPGQNAVVPHLRTLGNPSAPLQPNPTFGIRIEDGRPLSPTVLGVGLAPSGLLGPCDLLISLIGATYVVFTDASGEASVPFPIPATPDFSGLTLYFQAGVFDSEGTAFGLGLSLTQGLKVRIGD